MRFKIDLDPYGSSSICPFVLFFHRPAWFGGRWDRLSSFQTREDALAFYEKIKDLPEYLP